MRAIAVGFPFAPRFDGTSFFFCNRIFAERTFARTAVFAVSGGVVVPLVNGAILGCRIEFCAAISTKFRFFVRIILRIGVAIFATGGTVCAFLYGIAAYASAFLAVRTIIVGSPVAIGGRGAGYRCGDYFLRAFVCARLSYPFVELDCLLP